MIWHDIGKTEFIDETMNASLYIVLLGQNLKSSAKKLRLGNNFVFQQNNDTKHTAKKTQAFFDENEINILEWLTQTPDLNSISNYGLY